MITQNRKLKSNRGGALLIVAYLGIMMVGVVGVYFYTSSSAANRESTVRETKVGVEAAAEFAAELAMSNLTDVEIGKNDAGDLTVEKDWVMRKPYGTDDKGSTERRITGKLIHGPNADIDRASDSREPGYEYVVSVRDVREAKKKEVMEPGWLASINPETYVFGEDPATSFTGAYEITAEARSLKPTAASATIRKVLELDYNSLANTLNKFAVWDQENPEKLADSTRNFVTELKIESNSALALPLEEKYIYNNSLLLVSGEDHYAKKSAFVVLNPPATIEGLATIKAAPSELYSVTNTYWDLGRMTVHFQLGEEPNPFIPRTIWFVDDNGKNGNPNRNNTYTVSGVTYYPDVDMIAKYPDRTHDQYVFGGKQAVNDFTKKNDNTGAALMYKRGRSVTEFDAEEKILQPRTAKSSDPGDMVEKALVVGKTDSILQLYINYVDTAHPAARAADAVVNTWKTNSWRQISLGHHSRNATKNQMTSIVPALRPLDNLRSTTRRRWSTLVWIKNQHGQFLVREYDTGTYASPTSSQEAPNGGAWFGTYRWMWYGGYYTPRKYQFGGFHDPEVIAFNNRLNYRKALVPRFLSLQELLGYQLTTDSEGVPAKVVNGSIVAGVPDFVFVDGERVPYDPNGTGTVFDEDYWRSLRPEKDNYGVTTATLKQMPELDGIYVLDETNTSNDYTRNGKRYKRYETLEDFAFERDINAGQVDEANNPLPEDIRRMTSLHMVLEDNPESNSTTSEGLYFDMGLTVTVVWPKAMTTSAEDEDFLKDASHHWWEGDHQESLTGRESHCALSSNVSEEAKTRDLEEGETRIQAFYKDFNFFDPLNPEKEIEAFYTMASGDQRVGFAKAEFNSKDPNKGKLTDAVTKMHPGATVWYYGPLQLYEFMAMFKADFDIDIFLLDVSHEMQEYYTEHQDEFNEVLTEWRIEKAKAKMETVNDGMTFELIEERFDPYHEDAKLQLSQLVALLYREERLTGRDVTWDAFGGKNQRVPAAYAKFNESGELVAMTMQDFNPTNASTEVPTTKMDMDLIPGEVYLNSKGLGLEPLGVDYGGPYVPIQFRQGKIQPNGQPTVPKIIWLENADTTKGEEDMTTLHEPPQWFVDEGLVEPMEKASQTEHRGRLGWHRLGPNPELPDDTGSITEEEYLMMYGDHYEFVVMGQKDFFPWRTIEMSTDAGTREFMAVVRPDVDQSTVVKEAECRPVLKPTSDMPTFVIDGPVLDGAGILVVNGNLEVKTTFAYHGLLVILGDLIVTPEAYVSLNENGNPYDSDGYELVANADGSYSYIAGGIQTRPEPVKEWRGQVIVQGKVILGGEVRITERSDSMYDKHPASYVDVRGSYGAIDDILDAWLPAAPNEGLVTHHRGWFGTSTAGGGSMFKD